MLKTVVILLYIAITNLFEVQLYDRDIYTLCLILMYS